jgi:putative transposase
VAFILISLFKSHPPSDGLQSDIIIYMKRRHLSLQLPKPTSFVTTSIVKLTPIFANEELMTILLNNINFYSIKCHIQIHGFVIIPNHLHLLLTGEEQRLISQFMGRLKQYSAKQIINWCFHKREVKLLNTFSLAAMESKRKHNHQVWQSRFHNIVITRYDDFQIKLNYIHNNPLQDRWKLCEKITDYQFSSARHYLTGEDVGIPIVELV